MNDAEGWRSLFLKWPSELPRRGVVVTSFGDQIPFHEFMLHDQFVLLQRRAPDTVGGRDVIVPYQQIWGLKMTEVVKPKLYREAGFAGPGAA